MSMFVRLTGPAYTSLHQMVYTYTRIGDRMAWIRSSVLVVGFDRCQECGFEYDLDDAPMAGAEITANVAELLVLLADGDGDVGARREPATWSPLEYTCHLRDVLLVQRERVLEARRTDSPSFAPMGRDERVAHDGYADQDPDDVARQLSDAAALFANVLDRLDPADLDRLVVYNYPRPAERSLAWVAVHTVHESRHHLLDVRRQVTG